MIKLKGKKKGLVRFFYLDEHKSCIRWRPSKKHDKAKSKPSLQTVAALQARVTTVMLNKSAAIIAERLNPF